MVFFKSMQPLNPIQFVLLDSDCKQFKGDFQPDKKIRIKQLTDQILIEVLFYSKRYLQLHE